MYRKYFFIISAALTLLLMTAASASAQLGKLNGEVMLKQADGNTAPVDKATVDVYRTDKGGNKSATTDKKGNFTIPLDVAGDYVLSVSAPNARPYLMRVKVREERYTITLEPGDGRRLTKDEVMSSLKGNDIPAKGGGTGAQGTATQGTGTGDTSAKAVDEAKMAEEKRKVEASNETVSRTFKAGNEAMKAKRYDEAIAQYDQGLAADPEQPALLTNKAFALTQRGVDRYNAGIKANDEAGKEAGKKDFRDAVATANKAVDLVNAEQVGADAAAQQRHTISKNLALNAKAEALRLFASKVDPSQVDAAAAAYNEYIETIADPAKKLEAQLLAARMLFETGQSEKAVAAYQKILESNPDNVEATLYTGLALYGTGDTSKYQEAANYLQKFVDKAPDTHPMKASAREVLDNLKQQNVKPQKSTTATGRRRG